MSASNKRDRETKKKTALLQLQSTPTSEALPTLETKPTLTQTSTIEPAITSTLEPTLTPTVEQLTLTPTKETGVLYEKDFEHLRNEDGEWKFGEIFNESPPEGWHQSIFYLSTVILGEPTARTIQILDMEGKPISSFEAWFVEIGCPDLKKNDGSLKRFEVMIWHGGEVPIVGRVNFTDNYYFSEDDPGHLQNIHIEDRDEFLSLFCYGEPVILTINGSCSEDSTRKIMQDFGINEPFPGISERGKALYFYGIMFDKENGIGKMDLPETPSFEEIVAWKEKRAEPKTHYLGLISRLMISK